jgi:hypothetical protein
MRTYSLQFVPRIALAVVLALSATQALAQCDFNAPGKAKGLKSAMVRSYNSCPGATLFAPNTATNAGIPACVPPTPHSDFVFDPAKGSCSIKISSKIESPCSSGVPTDCSVTIFQARCRGILEPGGIEPICGDCMQASGVGWNLNMVLRETRNDPSNGDMTVIDFPFQILVPPARKGSFKLKHEATCIIGFCDLFGPGSETPPCRSLQLVSMSLADPSGGTFAVLGSSTR